MAGMWMGEGGNEGGCGSRKRGGGGISVSPTERTSVSGTGEGWKRGFGCEAKATRKKGGMG